MSLAQQLPHPDSRRVTTATGSGDTGSIDGDGVEVRFDPARPNLDPAAWDGLREYRLRLMDDDRQLLPLPT